MAALSLTSVVPAATAAAAAVFLCCDIVFHADEYNGRVSPRSRRPEAFDGVTPPQDRTSPRTSIGPLPQAPTPAQPSADSPYGGSGRSSAAQDTRRERAGALAPPPAPHMGHGNRSRSPTSRKSTRSVSPRKAWNATKVSPSRRGVFETPASSDWSSPAYAAHQMSEKQWMDMHGGTCVSCSCLDCTPRPVSWSSLSPCHPPSCAAKESPPPASDLLQEAPYRPRGRSPRGMRRAIEGCACFIFTRCSLALSPTPPCAL
jgi:hypothetical protein